MQNRRQFLARTTVVASMAAAFTTQAASKPHKPLTHGCPVRLGGPVPGKIEDPEEWARAHRKLGYRAAYCPNINLTDSDRIRATAAAFEKYDVALAEVGRWVNLMDKDPEKRKTNLKTVTDGLALAEAVGARCCVDIAGSMHPTSWFGPHPDNFSKDFFDAAVENARKIVDAVNPKRAKFCYEMMGWAMPESVDRCRAMVRAVDRTGFGVHLDPCNLINSPEKFYRNADLLNECFDKLGKWIVSCHAKDLTWDIEMNVHFREVIPGTGAVDYTTWLRRLAEMPNQPPLMMEHLASSQEYDRGREFILNHGAKAGIAFA